MHEMVLYVIRAINLLLSARCPAGFRQFDRFAIIRLQYRRVGDQTWRLLIAVAVSIAFNGNGSTFIRSKFRTEGFEGQYFMPIISTIVIIAQFVEHVLHAIVVAQRDHVLINVEGCQPFGMRSEAVETGGFCCVL